MDNSGRLTGAERTRLERALRQAATGTHVKVEIDGIRIVLYPMPEFAKRLAERQGA